MAQNTQRQSSGSKTIWFILLLLVLVLAAVVYLARYAVENARVGQAEEMERSFTFQAQNQVTQLSLWYGSLRDQIAQVSGTDTLRLFASEVDSNAYAPGPILTRSFQEAGQSSLNRDAANISGSTQMALQAPMVRNQLAALAERAGFQSVRLFTLQGQLLLSSQAEDLQFSPRADLAAQIRAVGASGEAAALPVYTEGDRLLLDVAVPVLAPLYIEASGEKVVGVLLSSLDITNLAGDYTFVAPQNSTLGSSLLIQNNNGRLQAVTAQYGAIDLPDWTLNSQGNLPLGERILPSTVPGGPASVYSLGLPVSNLDWLVAYEQPVSKALAAFKTQRQNIIVTAVLAGAVLTMLLLMLWWWLLGRRERSVNAQIKDLYQTVNEQKQIMDGVNSSLSEGIVFNTLTGDLPYANNSFIMMAEETPESMASRTVRTLKSRVLAANITAHTETVRSLNMPSSFLETLSVLGYYRHFQISCSPFRDQNGAMTGMVSLYRDITELVLAQERAQNMVNKTISVFVRSIEAVDPYLRGQAAWTGRLAVILAERLGYADHAVTLQTAANLSQIGMIQLPRELITKNEKLTPEERAQLETHVLYAQQALEGIDFGYPVLEAISQMHERLDGSGYPNHLRGGQIGLDGRILAVANTFCALMRPRSYRRAISIQDAGRMMLTDPPTYDPNVVQALSDFLATPEGQEFLTGLTAPGNN